MNHYDPQELTKAPLDRAAAVRRAAVESHNRRIRGRIPLYTKAILEVKALIVAGQDVRHLGEDTPWPKAFAPLTLKEKRLCRDEAVRKHLEAAE